MEGKVNFMRKFISLALAVLMLFSAASVGIFTVSAENGAELPANAEPIESSEDFMAMESDGNYYLAADITIDFSYARAFTGFFDGQGHTVTTEYPLFTSLDGATVCNVTIAGEIDDSEYASPYVGALAFETSDARIENVHNTADVTGADTARVGGLIGLNYSDTDLYVANCSNSGKISGLTCGGIIAESDGDDVEIRNCRNSGDVESLTTGTSDSIGGIVGMVNNKNVDLLIEGCINTGKVTGGRAGGILGYSIVRDLEVNYCVNTGDVTSIVAAPSGGIAGRPQSMTFSTFRSCVNTGTVVGGGTQAGGIVGYSGQQAAGYDGSVSFYGCVNLGTVMRQDYMKGDSGCNLGGIAGRIDGKGEFFNCVNAGNLYNSTYMGGMVAKVGDGSKRGSHIVSGCYVTGELCSSGAGYTGVHTDGVSGLIAHAYAAVLVTNTVVAADMKMLSFAFPSDNVKKMVPITAGVSYANNSSCIFQNFHDVSTYTAGENVTKFVLVYSHDNDLTAKIGNNIKDIYTANDYPLHRNHKTGLSANTGKPVNKADYTDERIVEILNEGVGYEAYTIVTDKNSNEFGITGILPVSVAEFLTAAESEAAAPIGTAEEFLAMKSNGNYYLTADITLPSSYTGFFKGTLDGKGYTLTVSNPVFEVLSSATVSDLTIKGSVASDATELTRSADDYRGALAIAGVGSTVTKVTNEASVSAYDTAGGIFGYMQGGALVDCVNKGTITASAQIGGLVGIAKDEEAHFEDCVNEGTLQKSLAPLGFVGGILGNASYTDVYFDGCVNNVAINVNAPASKDGSVLGAVGGILGHASAPIYIEDADIGDKSSYQRILVCTVVMTDCLNNGKITAHDYAGGMIGLAEVIVDLTNCVNNAEIFSAKNIAGGLVAKAGTVYQYSEVTHTFEGCVNNGKVVSYEQLAGGIVAYCMDNSFFERCVNNAEVTGLDVQSKDRVIVAGGILGRGLLDGKFEGCVNLGDVSGNQRVGGIVGDIGVGGAMGEDGNHSFLNCYVGGTVYNTNVCTVAGSEKTNGTGGLFGFAINAIDTEITVQYCGITADITGVVTSAKGPRIVGALGGFCNTPNAVYQDNYFTGLLSDGGSGLGVCVFLAYADATPIRSANITGNFTSNKSIIFYNDIYGMKLLEADFENFVDREAAETGELCYRLNQSIGEDIFFQQLGEQNAPMPFSGEGEYAVRFNEATQEYYNVYTPAEEEDDDTTEPEPPVTDPDDGTTEIEPPVTDPDDGTTEPDPDDGTTKNDPPVTDPSDATTAPETDASDDGKGGCGSVVGASLAIAAVMLVAPAALVLKKRDEE